MAHLIATAVFGLALVYLVFTISSWRRSYLIAKATGFPVFLSPIHVTSIWWLMFNRFLLPVLDKLPKLWTSPWLQMAQVWNIWKFGHKPFQDAGTDTFILSTPAGNMLWTCDAKVCQELTTQHPKAQVAVDMVKFFQLYGPNLGSVEGPQGQEWKRHRNVITPAFGSTTNAMVWKESTLQTQAMMRRWSEDDNVVSVMTAWTSRLALHVVAAVFFRKNLTWTKDSSSNEALPNGHLLSFEDAIFQVVKSIGTLFVVPKALRGLLPIESVRRANVAFTEWTRYMQEISSDTLARVDEISNKKHKSIVESIVLGAKSGDNYLPEESILGNIFFIMLAGHETAGNTMAFAFNILALYPEYQAKIQAELDHALAERPQEEWTIDREYQAFQKGWIGAVLTEVLRLYNVTQFHPRQIVAPMSVVDSQGTSHSIPAGTLCLIDMAAAFKNPNVWPRRTFDGSRRAELRDSPALDFQPEQWLPGAKPMTSPDGSAPLHFPFSQGPHFCPGKQFAQVEMCAALATVFLEYSLEPVVDEQTLASCGGDRKAAQEHMRDRGFRTLIDDVTTNINVQLLEPLPIRLVGRV